MLGSCVFALADYITYWEWLRYFTAPTQLSVFEVIIIIDKSIVIIFIDKHIMIIIIDENIMIIILTNVP